MPVVVVVMMMMVPLVVVVMVPVMVVMMAGCDRARRVRDQKHDTDQQRADDFHGSLRFAGKRYIGPSD